MLKKWKLTEWTKKEKKNKIQLHIVCEETCFKCKDSDYYLNKRKLECFRNQTKQTWEKEIIKDKDGHCKLIKVSGT